jgi:hypothetical protein
MQHHPYVVQHHQPNRDLPLGPLTIGIAWTDRLNELEDPPLAKAPNTISYRMVQSLRSLKGRLITGVQHLVARV